MKKTLLLLLLTAGITVQASQLYICKAYAVKNLSTMKSSLVSAEESNRIGLLSLIKNEKELIDGNIIYHKQKKSIIYKADNGEMMESHLNEKNSLVLFTSPSMYPKAAIFKCFANYKAQHSISKTK